MLTIDNDSRFYGRGATGNRRLTEGEVARLYERRERWNADRSAELDRVVDAMPFQFGYEIDQVGPIVVTLRPVTSHEGLVRVAAAGADVIEFLRQTVREEGRLSDPYPDHGNTGIESVYQAGPVGANRWVLSRENDPATPYQSMVDIEADGGFTYWHSPTINVIARRGQPDRQIFMEIAAVRALHQAVACANRIYSAAKYRGPIDIGVAVLGIENAISGTLAQGFGDGIRYGAPEFRATGRVNAYDVERPSTVVRELLSPLFDAFAARNFDPYTGSSAEGLEP